LTGRHRLRTALCRVPVTLLVLVVTTLLFVADHTGGSTHHAATALARYRADALLRAPWQLPLSALLPQSGPQWAWTVVVGGALFVALERRVGSVRAAAVLALGHVVPTLVVACWAHATGAVPALHREDFGTSCLIMAAAGALLVLLRSWLLLTAVAVTFAVDGFVNAPTTVVEHLIALAVGAVSVAAPVSRRRRPARGTRRRRPSNGRR
jgi:hypothetical protein